MGAGATVPAPAEGVNNENSSNSSSNNNNLNTGKAVGRRKPEQQQQQQKQPPPQGAAAVTATGSGQVDVLAGPIATASYRCQLRAPPQWAELPSCECILSIGNESLLLREASPQGAVLKDIAFQQVLCWGYNQDALELRVFDTLTGQNKSKTIDVLLPTTDGAQIAVTLFKAVQRLKHAIDGHGLNNEDFESLLTVLREDKTRLQQRELYILRSFGGARQIQGVQAVQVLKELSYMSRFDHLDAACILYERLLHKDTEYLILENLTDNDEKENLRHRLGLKPITA